jgi:hypothetical protein
MIDTARDDHRGTTAAENDGGGEGRRQQSFLQCWFLE